MTARKCWLCAPGQSAEVVYVDPIGCWWCEDHYREYYLEDDS